MRRLLPILALLAVAPAAAGAHRDPLWSTYTPVPASKARRVADLGRRTAALALRMPNPSTPAAELVAAGQCGAAEALLRAEPLPWLGRVRLAGAAAALNDATCADRLLAVPAAAPPAAGEELRQALSLYEAGAIWRRIGQEEKGLAAIREAELRIEAYKLANPDWESGCHTGCEDPVLSALDTALRIYHGSPLLAREAERLAGEAIPSLTIPRDDFAASSRARAVVRRLLVVAGQENDTALLARLAPYEDKAEGMFWTARAEAAFGDHRIAEAVALQSRAPFFNRDFTEDHLREAPQPFHDARTTIRVRHDNHRTNELRASLAAVWLERGDTVRAREAWESADADRRAGSPGWFNVPAARLDAVELMLNEAAPVAVLSRRRFDSVSSRDYAFRELALILAATGRWAEFDTAAAQYSHQRDRAWMIARLPCTAARSGNASAVAGALARAGAHGNPPPAGEWVSLEQELAALHRQNAVCLVRYGFTASAIDYTIAHRSPAEAVATLLSLARSSPLATREAQRRRLALAAFRLVERNRLWNAPETAALAEQLERVAAHRRVERLLARAGNDALRLDIYRDALGAYRLEY